MLVKDPFQITMLILRHAEIIATILLRIFGVSFVNLHEGEQLGLTLITECSSVTLWLFQTHELGLGYLTYVKW